MRQPNRPQESEFIRWWRLQPLITKYLVFGSLVLTIVAALGILSPYTLVIYPSYILQKFQIWRLVTGFFYHGKLGLPFLINMYFLWTHSKELETIEFAGRTADYLFFIILSLALSLVAAVLLGWGLIGGCVIFAIIYYWSRKNPERPMSFMFGIRFKGFYLPWVLIAFRFLIGSLPLQELFGVVIGHIYYFLQDVYPTAKGEALPTLKTPAFMLNLFEETRQKVGQGTPARGHNWGAGRVLGDN